MSKIKNSEKFLRLKIVKNILDEYQPSDLQIENIEIYFQKYGYRKSQDHYSRLSYFLKNGIVNFIEEEEKLLSYERMSKEYFCILYGKILGEEKWEQHCKKTRKGRPSCIEYWIKKGYSEKESKILVSNHQKNMSDRSSKNRNHQKYSIRCVEYWIEKGYTDEESEELIYNLQRRDLAFYIEKYGKDIGIEKYQYSCNKRKNTWQKKTFEERKLHFLKTLPKEYNKNGQEMQAIRLFLEQNNIRENCCMFGKPQNQFYQWIDNVGFRRYDLAVFFDESKNKLIYIMEYHGPGHINFSDYTPDLKDKIIEVNGRSLPHLGTYGLSYCNDMIKREHILEKYPDCKYYVFWNNNLKKKDLKIYDVR